MKLTDPQYVFLALVHEQSRPFVPFGADKRVAKNLRKKGMLRPVVRVSGTLRGYKLTPVAFEAIKQHVAQWA